MVRRRKASSSRDSAVLASQLLNERDVGLHRTVFGQALLAGPGVELGATLEVHHPRTAALDVSDGALLVKRVELEQLVGGGSLGELLDRDLRGLEFVGER